MHAGANIGYLPQEPQLPEGATVLQAVLQSDNAVTKAVQQYQNALQASVVKGGQANKVRGLPYRLWCVFQNALQASAVKWGQANQMRGLPYRLWCVFLIALQANAVMGAQANNSHLYFYSVFNSGMLLHKQLEMGVQLRGPGDRWVGMKQSKAKTMLAITVCVRVGNIY
eukprot:732728-Pelagomonas_calceolata.AAC.5